MNIVLSSVLAVCPGCWDCLGLTDTEIEIVYGIKSSPLMAYEDDYWDETVGQIPMDSTDLGPPGVLTCAMPAGVIK